MATTPGAFYSDYATPSEVGFLVGNMPHPKNFTTLHDGTANVGAEAFQGNNANEIFKLGTGDTVISGGKGYDVVVTDHDYVLNPGVESAVLTGTADINVTGSNVANNLIGNDGDNDLSGLGRDDVIIGNGGDDNIDGGSGDDRLFGDAGLDTLHGGLGDDTLQGGAGNDTLFGDGGHDILKGMAGDDQLFGGGGADTLIGGEGDDILAGGSGSDTLIGGGGADTFMIGHDVRMDEILDFSPGVDTIDVSGTNTTSFDQLSLRSDHHGNTIVTTHDGTKFKLVGFDPNDIDGSFFSGL
jgi:Ca2+-binding RTX toxin-like protein